MAYLNKNEDKLLAEKLIGQKDEYVIQFPILSSDWVSSAGDTEKIKKATLDPRADSSDTRKAVASAVPKTDPQRLDKNSIASASLGLDQSSGGRPLFKRAGDQYDEKTGVLKRDGMTIDPKTRAFQFGQSQSLTAIINQVILSSKYATDALDPKNLVNGFIKWFKLDVQIELLKLDILTGDYAKKITYRVVPYLVHQSIFTNATSAPVGYTDLTKDIVKEYQYIYTGQNVDILSFNIEINNLFYSGIAPKPADKGANTANQNQKPSEKLNPSAKTGKGQAPEVQSAQTGRSRKKRDPELLKGYKGGSENKSVEQNVAENFQQAFISGSSADMVVVTMEILGDPYWLVDSGIGNHFSAAPAPTSQILDDGTMNYEAGNVFIYITFRTPADVNTLTGLYDFSIAGKESPFGGIYRVNKCENTFSDGNWKQKLTCLRMPGPQGPEVNKTVTGDKPSVIDKASTPAVEIGPVEPPSTSPIESSTAVNLTGSDADKRAAISGQRNTATATTTTTSNQPTRVVGFRYYRDLGQN
jgi:hypothetical protein